jgi:hypothetical protein
VKSELLTAKFFDIFFDKISLSTLSFAPRSQLLCQRLHIHSSVPSSIHQRRIFFALLGALQSKLHVAVVHPAPLSPFITPSRSVCDSEFSNGRCVLVAFDTSTLHLYDIFHPHFGRAAVVNINERDSMFHSSRELWFALNSSCSEIDVVDATSVPSQSVLGVFQAFAAAFSLSDSVQSVFTDELPVNNWELSPIAVASDHHAQFSEAFSSHFKHVASLTEELELSSLLSEAQTSLTASLGSWPPCIVAYLPAEPCTNAICMQSLKALAVNCSRTCDDASMVIIGESSSPLSDSTLALFQETLNSIVSRMFYVDNDDVFDERESAPLIHMMSSSSCGFVATLSSSVATQAALTR